VKIRMSDRADFQLGLAAVEKKALAQHLASHTARAGALCRHAADDPRACEWRAGNRQSAFSTLPIAIQNANLDDLRVIAHEFQGGDARLLLAGIHGGCRDGPDQENRRFKGKVVAINAGGGAVDIAIRTMAAPARPRSQPRLRHRGAPLPTMAACCRKEADLIRPCRRSQFDRPLRRHRPAAVRQQRTFMA